MQRWDINHITLIYFLEQNRRGKGQKKRRVKIRREEKDMYKRNKKTYSRFNANIFTTIKM